MERVGQRVRIPSRAQRIGVFDSKSAEVQEMSEAKDVLRIAGMVLLGVFVVAVGVPLVLTAAGVTLGIIGFLFHLAVMLIKVAVVLAIGYLILVGVRAMLR
jgi:ABC-type transport system involved in cytochrome bd biosynthesis fused ATPase/permease subunit